MKGSNMTTQLNCRDCRDFAPIDVVKGMCHTTKAIVLGDAEQCSDFDLMPKCKNCTMFTADTTTVEMGLCQASTMEPKFFAFPDMVSLTCESYKELSHH